MPHLQILFKFIYAAVCEHTLDRSLHQRALESQIAALQEPLVELHQDAFTAEAVTTSFDASQDLSHPGWP